MEETESMKVMKHVSKVVLQYEEGAILASEALFNIVNAYLEKQDEIAKEHKESFSELGSSLY